MNEREIWEQAHKQAMTAAPFWNAILPLAEGETMNDGERVALEQLGYDGGGPLRILADEDLYPYIHIGWPEAGMYITPNDARTIARVLVAAAELHERRLADGNS